MLLTYIYIIFYIISTVEEDDIDKDKLNFLLFILNKS